MALNEKEFITGVLSKTLNLDDAGVAALYNADGTMKDDALTNVLDLDVKRIAAVKPDTKKHFDEGYKKAQSEVLTKRDKELKDKFGITSDKIGVELFNEIISEQVKKAGGELNEDAVKKHPVYISAVDKLTKDKEDAVKAETEKLTQFQTEQKKKETFSSVSSKALDFFNSLKPILSTDQTKAKNQMNDFVDKLKGYEYEVQDDDKIIVLKDGKVLEDGHGNRVPFEKVVKETADKYYDFHQAEKRSNAGNGKDEEAGKAGSSKSPLTVPKNADEFYRTVADSSIPAKDRAEYQTTYEKQFTN
ncbi:MAG: hypothetical protein V4549_06690 [Bacteroidota bacterium]